MLEKVLVAVIVAVAAFFLVRTLLRSARGEGSCRGCRKGGSCPGSGSVQSRDS